jgi:TIR domain
MTNIFISWGGEQSRAIAEELRNWIPSVLQFAKPYFTPNDIEKGTKWNGEISKKLAECNVGIICLTKDNLHRPWVLFEAGALSKDMDKSRVCSVLFGMDDTDLSGPLTTFQATKFEKSDFKKMMSSINDSGSPHNLALETFEKVFDMWWPQLEVKVRGILDRDVAPKGENIRSDRELLEEVLSLTRSRSRISHRGNELSEIHPDFPRDLVKHISKIIETNERLLDPTINNSMGGLLRMAKYLLATLDSSDAETMLRVAELQKLQSDMIPF